MLEAREHGYDVEDFFQEVVDVCADDATKQKLELQEMAWKQNINTAYSSSMGRLFDAAAALLDICHYNSYEGECAIKLEQAAHKGFAELKQSFKTEVNLDEWMKKVDLQVDFIEKSDVLQANSVKLLTGLFRLKHQYSKDVLAYLFHYVIANAIIGIVDRICEVHDVNQVALSGGTFINRILLSKVVYGLKAKEKKVYINEKVPCGDGGIALGQMYLMTFE